MCNSNPLPLTPPCPLNEVQPEAYFEPKCKAFSDERTFILISSDGVEMKMANLHPYQLSALILAWRQGCFCGETGESLAFLINTYGKLSGDEVYDLF